MVTPSENVDQVILFRLSVGGSDDYAVYTHTEPGHFSVGSTSGPWLGPLASESLLFAVVAVAAFVGDTIAIESIEATSASWGEGQIAEALLPALNKWARGGANFTIDGVTWTSNGEGFAHPLDFDQTSIVLAKDSWSNNRLGMPMMADSGTYLLVKMGLRFRVLHQSEGFVSLERAVMADSDKAAIREFEAGWTSQSDSEADDGSDDD